MQSAVSMAPLIPSTPARTITVVATAVAAIFCLSSALSVHCHQHPVPAVATQSDFTTFFTPSSLLNDSSDGNVAGRDFVGSVDGHVSPPSVRGRRSPPPTGKGGSGDIRKSAFVCQDGTLRLSCTAGKHIDVLRANFGRFSITLCNPSGTLDWSVNCASGNSLSVLTQSH
ncbi:hypothetical protein TYRP_000466 [Tyrophagus putrescentiae]|nr:hypothetical protein TYRP_000466 [Tyrophagus putrescentiae]